MTPSVTIKSAHDGTTLELCDRDGQYYCARIRGAHVEGESRVYEFEPSGVAGLDSFFRDLATHWRGWQGEKEWRSLEGELVLSAASDSTGHTTLSVRLRSGPYPFDWSLSVALLLEAGHLEQIASDVERFVRDA